LNNTNGYLEPLVAIYAAEDLKKLIPFWQSQQTSLRHFLESINPVILPVPQNNDILSIDTQKTIKIKVGLYPTFFDTVNL
jgi:molybdopterin-guanine dinucleotide biosynthesis protein A